MRNMTPMTQALSVIALTTAICGYEAVALAVAIVSFGIEMVVTFALASEDDEGQGQS